MWLLILIKVYMTSSQKSECPNGNNFVNLGSTCYWFSSDVAAEKRSWPDARKRCQELGTHISMKVDLAEIGYSYLSDQLLLYTIGDKGDWVWLGASDAESENVWKWVTSGRSLSLRDSLWWDTQPNSEGENSGNCLVGFNPTPTRINIRTYIGDWQCEKQLAFVCQIF
ncbi:unnamed protein product, partial [Meganyctiphanes norvegica]